MSTIIRFRDLDKDQEVIIRVPGDISEEDGKQLWIATRPIGMYSTWGPPIEPDVVQIEEEQ